MKTSIRLAFQSLAVISLFAGMALSPGIQEEANVQITQIDTDEFPRVTFFVSITDANGQPLAVDANRLVIMENGEQIPLDQIEGIGDVGPITTLLVIDVSDSMIGDKLNAAKAAANEFINRMRAEDQVGIIAFDTVVDNVQPLTSDQATLHAAVDSLTAQRNTAMYDALIEATEQLKGIEGRKAIILLSDGLDNSSSANRDEVINQLGGAEGFSISAVGFGDPGQSASDSGIDEPVLRDLTSRGGGLYAYTADQDALANLFAAYAVGLQSEYQITYTSPAALRDGVNRALSVALAPVGGGSPIGGDQGTKYNPGGLVPEVAQPASWPFFGLVVAILAALVIIPMIFTNWRSGSQQSQMSGTNGRASRTASSGRVSLKSKRRPRIKLR